MFDVVARQQCQRLVRREPVTQQALGNRTHAVEHLAVADAAPITTSLAGRDKRLLGPHLGPMHQAIEQARRQLGQGLQGAHMQHAVFFSDRHRGVADGDLAVSRCGLGLRSEFGTHKGVLQQGGSQPPCYCYVATPAQIG